MSSYETQTVQRKAGRVIVAAPPKASPTDAHSTATSRAATIDYTALRNPQEITAAARTILGPRSVFAIRLNAAAKNLDVTSKALLDITSPNGARYPMHTSTMSGPGTPYTVASTARCAAYIEYEKASQALLQTANKRAGGALTNAWVRWNRGG